MVEGGGLVSTGAEKMLRLAMVAVGYDEFKLRLVDGVLAVDVLFVQCHVLVESREVLELVKGAGIECGVELGTCGYSLKVSAGEDDVLELSELTEPGSSLLKAEDSDAIEAYEASGAGEVWVPMPSRSWSGRRGSSVSTDASRRSSAGSEKEGNCSGLK